MEAPGKVIVQARKKQQLSQEELARQSGVSLRTIQRIEKGSVNPHGHTLKTLVNALNLQLTDLEEKAKNINFPKLKSLNAIGLLIIIAPAIHVLIQLVYWNKLAVGETKRIGARFISFQLLWLLGTLLTFVLIHVVSYLIAGQSVIGHFPYRLTAYLGLLILNVIVITRTAIQLNSNQAKILDRIPSLI